MAFTVNGGAVLNVTNRSMNYVWWVIPIIYVLWPGNKCKRKNKIDSELKVNLLASINDPKENYEIAPESGWDENG